MKFKIPKNLVNQARNEINKALRNKQKNYDNAKRINRPQRVVNTMNQETFAERMVNKAIRMATNKKGEFKPKQFRKSIKSIATNVRTMANPDLAEKMSAVKTLGSQAISELGGSLVGQVGLSGASKLINPITDREKEDGGPKDDEFTNKGPEYNPGEGIGS